MDPIKKYPRQRSFKIHNLQEIIAQNLLIAHRPTSRDNVQQSFLVVYRSGTRLEFHMFFGVFERDLKLRMQIYMRLVNKNPNKSIVWENEKEVAHHENILKETLNMEEVMNVENGWLINGTMTIECGAYLKAILGKNGIWKFNFWDPVYDYDNCNEVMLFENVELCFYCYKLLPIFHSPYIDSVTVDYTVTLENDIHRLVFENCLQLVHGVRMKLEESKLKSIISIARSLKLYNVVHYCQYQLIANKKSVEDLKFAFEFNTHHYLAHLLGLVESREELKGILKEMNIQKMSGESMKQCTRFFFDVEI